MFKLRCCDVGFDCPGVITGVTQAEVLAQAGEHASAVHGVQVTSAMAGQVMALIREEGAADGRRSFGQ